jgi:hypothetical protein
MNDQNLYETLKKEEVALEEQLRHIRELMKFYAPRVEIPTVQARAVISKNPIIAKKKSEPTGFRDNIRAVLTSNSEGMRPFEVANALEENGFEYGGNTPLKQVVSSELYRMEQSKQLVKRDGRYLIKQN